MVFSAAWLDLPARGLLLPSASPRTTVQRVDEMYAIRDARHSRGLFVNTHLVWDARHSEGLFVNTHVTCSKRAHAKRERLVVTDTWPDCLGISKCLRNVQRILRVFFRPDSSSDPNGLLYVSIAKLELLDDDLHQDLNFKNFVRYVVTFCGNLMSSSADLSTFGYVIATSMKCNVE